LAIKKIKDKKYILRGEIKRKGEQGTDMIRD